MQTTAMWRNGPGAPFTSNDPAQLIDEAYHPSYFQSGRVVQVPPNYGTEGSLSINDWTPTLVPRVGSVTPAPLPAWNLLVPIRWDLQVITDQSLAVRGQATLTQVPEQSSATYTPPGTASLTVDDNA
jgi:hypothetical protein